MSAIESVSGYVDEHRHRWLDKDNDYWLQRLMQEVGEVASVVAGDHEDPLEHELAQIASLAINWIRKLSGGKPRRLRPSRDLSKERLTGYQRRYQTIVGEGMAGISSPADDVLSFRKLCGEVIDDLEHVLGAIDVEADRADRFRLALFDVAGYGMNRLQHAEKQKIFSCWCGATFSEVDHLVEHTSREGHKTYEDRKYPSGTSPIIIDRG